MTDTSAKEWSLKELAVETGLTERTIRFYISRGLVDPPLRGGRGAAYGEKHMVRLQRIREFQAKDEKITLAEIAHDLALEDAASRSDVTCKSAGRKEPDLRPEAPGIREQFLFNAYRLDAAASNATDSKLIASLIPQPETWRSFRLSPDVVVVLRAGESPWRARRVLSALGRFAAEVIPTESKEDKDE